MALQMCSAKTEKNVAVPGKERHFLSCCAEWENIKTKNHVVDQVEISS